MDGLSKSVFLKIMTNSETTKRQEATQRALDMGPYREKLSISLKVELIASLGWTQLINRARS
jgi:hypothetical protein